jgi:hypothetical protein
MDGLTTLATGLGSAWLAGINLYATVVTLGGLQRLGLARLPGDLEVLADGRIIGLAAILYVVEFLADKIPAVDTAWDAVHTFVRVPAGAVLAAGAFADFDPPVRVAALLIGGSLALGSHGGKAATRVALNATAPGAGVALSLAEDVFAFGSSVLMVALPLVFLGVLAVALIATAWMGPRVVRGVGGLFRTRTSRPPRRSPPSQSAWSAGGRRRSRDR